MKLLWLGSRRNRGPVDRGGGKLLERSACWPMCSGMEEWWSDSGNGAWFLPPTEEVAESGYCMQLGIPGGRGSIGDGIGDGVKAVDNGVDWCDGWDGEVVMMEVNHVGDVEGLDFGIDGPMAAVMLTGAAAEVPDVVGAGLLLVMTGQASGRRGVAL